MLARHLFPLILTVVAGTSQSVVTTSRTLADGEPSTYAVTLASSLPTALVVPIPDCVHCGSKMQGLFESPIGASSTSVPWSLPTGDRNAPHGDITKSTPTSTNGVGVWYRQEWTIPATWLLCIYSILSCILLMTLIFSGKLDLHGNMHFGRGAQMTRASSQLYTSATVRTGARQPVRARYRSFREDQHSQLHQRGRPNSIESFAETRISYGDDDEELQRAHYEREFDMQPVSFSGREDDTLHAVMLEAETRGPTPATLEPGHLRQALDDDHYHAHVRLAQVHELRRLEASMARAGWV